MAEDDTLLTDQDDTDIGDDKDDKGGDDSSDDSKLDLITKDDDTDDSDDDDDKSDDDDDDTDDDKSDDDDKDDDTKDDKSDDDSDDDADDDEGITIPEGVIVDETVMVKFEETVKELGLKKEGAQKLFDLQVELSKKQDADFQGERVEWVKAIKDDEEYGGDNFDASKVAAMKAMKRFGTPEFSTLLKQSGFGDHPELFKTMVNIGRAMGEADFIDGAPPGDLGDRDPADVLFGDMTKDN